MSLRSIFRGRFALLYSFSIFFLVASLLVRVALYLWQPEAVSWNLIAIARTFATGFFFDIGTLSLFILPATIYFAILPSKLIGTYFDRIFVLVFFAVILVLVVFTFFAEITFWEEFKSRFNFIAVDYLIYTHEVLQNIKESYSLPLLAGGILLISILIAFLFRRFSIFKSTFENKPQFSKRAIVLINVVIVAVLFAVFIPNTAAEWSANRYNSEISKSGIYSFFSAFRNNRMDYNDFYTTIPNDQATELVRSRLSRKNSVFLNKQTPIHRKITDSTASAQNPNVVFILVESLSASFLSEFGNKDNITPFLDNLANNSVFFTNLFATGTRTVRGMEALTLSIPPTPGQSIVKRPENGNLYTISNVFKERNYDCSFFYGGDGYFDNMNAFYGGNGFDIYDRGRGSILSDKIKGKRYNIPNSEVTFENAWGICDEDIFQKTIAVADAKYAQGKPFLNYIMTTSNHRPYSYPANKIDIPSGTSRKGAVKYTDYALRQFFEKASSKPWFKNTVFVIVADHCASSAGKDEIDVANYRIPAFIVNLPNTKNFRIDKQCSQIDLFPTLFGLLHWNYESDFFGSDVNSDEFSPRAFIGTYRKLAMLNGSKIVVLSDQQKQNCYNWNKEDNRLIPSEMDSAMLHETIAWYQVADYLFINKLLK